MLTLGYGLKICLLAMMIVVFVIYPFLIAPRTIRKPDMSPFYPFFYAHRGLYDNASDAPENSMEAFRRAVAAGYGIELDVQLTGDRVPVVFHDYRLERMCGQSGKLSDYTYEELQQFRLGKSQERIPRLEDVLKLVDGKVPLIVELKIASLDVSVCSYADRVLSGYRGLYCVESFNPLGLGWYRIHRSRVVRGQLSDRFLRKKEYGGVTYFFLQNLLVNFIGRPDFVAYNHRYYDTLSRRICCGLFRATAVAWTVGSQEELSCAGKYYDMYIFEGFTPCR